MVYILSLLLLWYIYIGIIYHSYIIVSLIAFLLLNAPSIISLYIITGVFMILFLELIIEQTCVYSRGTLSIEPGHRMLFYRLHCIRIKSYCIFFSEKWINYLFLLNEYLTVLFCVLIFDMVYYAIVYIPSLYLYCEVAP